MSHDKLSDRSGFRGPDGYPGGQATDALALSVSPCGIEDVDRAVYDLFDSVLKLEIMTDGALRKVPIVFAVGERFAQLRRRDPIRDTTGALILPLISIRRIGIEQPMDTQMGIAKNVGSLVVRRRLSRADPLYQLLRNKVRLHNQLNVASHENIADTLHHTGSVPGGVASRRPGAEPSLPLVSTPLADRLTDNVYEIVSVPFPKFYAATYEIVVWSQYTGQMNALLEQLMWAYNADGHQYLLRSQKGYYFVGYVDDSIRTEDNLDDIAHDERTLRHVITLRVPAYIIAPMHPGEPVSIRRQLSAPQVSFEMYMDAIPASRPDASPVGDGALSKFVLDEIDTLNVHGERDPMRGERDLVTQEIVPDPFTDKLKPAYVRIKSRNQRSGETVLGARTLTDVGKVIV